MRVVEISPVIGSGSVGRIVDQIFEGLIKNGDKCIAICGTVGNTIIPKNNRVVSVSSYARMANAFHARLFDSDGFCLFSGMQRILNEIESFQPDIVHMHGAYGYYLNMEVLYRFINKKDYYLVNTMHSCWDYTGHCCYYIYAGCNKWKTECNRCPEKRAYPTSLLMDNSRNNYRKKKRIFTGNQREIIVTPSKWLADEVKQSYMRDYPVKIINNGINTDVFKRINIINSHCFEKYRIPRNKIIILGVAGYWDRRKGLADFIELNNWIDDDMHIVIVGVNERQKKDIPHCITAISRTENPYELAELYSMATILFNPTYEDNYPTVNLEAIACGTPVVTYESGGSGEAVSEYNFGAVIPKKQFNRIIRIARYYYENEPDLNDQIINTISSERMVKDYYELFNRIMRNPTMI